MTMVTLIFSFLISFTKKPMTDEGMDRESTICRVKDRLPSSTSSVTSFRISR